MLEKEIDRTAIQPDAMRVKTWRGLRPISEFDEVEIRAMGAADDLSGGLWQLEDCSPGSPTVAYSVFLHCGEGGIECVQDFYFDPNEQGLEDNARQDAEMLAEQLYDMLRASGMLLWLRSDSHPRPR